MNLHQRLVLEIACLVNLPIIQPELEVVVIGACGKVVVIVSKNVLSGEEGAKLIIFDPEHRIFDRLAAEVARAVKHRTHCIDACAHAVGTLVKLPTLDYVIGEHLR